MQPASTARSTRLDGAAPPPWPWPRLAAWLLVGVLTGGLLPALVGLAESGVFELRPDVASPATTIGVATLCYLAAGATGIRWMAWAAVPVTSALPFLAEVLGLSRWVLMTLVGMLLLGLGLASRRRTTWPQAAAMAGYFGVALLALLLAPRLGLALAGLALAAHAAWDLRHYRRDAVVNRSLAVWCMGLDVALGGMCVVFAVAG